MTDRPSRIVGVRRLADYLKRKVESDAALRNLSVRGEVTNYAVGRSGHVNFDLKEGDAVLRCFAWASDAPSFPPLRNGLAIVAKGNVSTYVLKSTYQLLVSTIDLEGIGNVHALFEERKARLGAEGVFDPARKRPLGAFPFAVALVSSPVSDGANDFMTILRQRAPHVRVTLFATPVQGAGAGIEIAEALRRASAADVDCIVLTRGGGSFEDLFAFSDEAVVRAVAHARHPVISAIGHTADQQLCDFAADLHLETPTAAAKAIGTATNELRARANDALRRIGASFDAKIERLAASLERAQTRSKLHDVRAFFAPLAQRIDALDASLDRLALAAHASRAGRVRELSRRLDVHDPTRRLHERSLRLARAAGALERAISRPREAGAGRLDAARVRLDRAATALVDGRSRRLEVLGARLIGNSPERLLQQGYAIVSYEGSIVRDAARVPAGARIEARVARGTLRARVEREQGDGNDELG